MTGTAPYNILFLCTGNSARSILAECIMNRLGRGKFVAYSAGSHPKGAVHPQAIKLLRSAGYAVDQLRSKSWDEFAKPGAPHLNFVVTVCDNAAGEVCPIWPGQPITSHWGMPDPAAVEGSDVQIALAFADVYRMLSNRIGIFASLPVEKLSALALKERMDEIGADEAVADADVEAHVQLLHPHDPRSAPLIDLFVGWLLQSAMAVGDLSDDQPRFFALKSADGQPMAFAGLALDGPDVLLRSLVVDPEARSKGAGSRIVKAMEKIAKAGGAQRLWSLTTTAEDWFLSGEWREVQRSEAPEAIQRTSQFKTGCPASAHLLVRDLT